MLRVIVVDEHPIVLRGLREVLRESFDGVEVDEAAKGYEAINRICTSTYHLAVLDIALSDINGLDAVKEIKKRRPRLPVLVMSIYPAEHYAIRAIRAGGQGYFSKKNGVEEFVVAVRKILAGKRYLSPAFAEKMLFEFESDLEKQPHEKLSNRELQVACMIGKGKAVKEITEELRLSINTVRTYRARVLEKMGVKTTGELIHYAVKNSLVD